MVHAKLLLNGRKLRPFFWIRALLLHRRSLLRVNPLGARLRS